MRVRDIAKEVDKPVNEVAVDLKLTPGTEAGKLNISNDIAKQYIAKHRKEEQNDVEREVSDKIASVKKPNVAKFWSAHGNNMILSGRDAKRSDITFSNWVYECDDSSAEAVFLRKKDTQNRCKLWEVYNRPYDNAETIAEFMTYLRSLIYTGRSPIDGPSREGRDSILAMLPGGVVKDIPTEVRNTPRLLIRVVSKNISLSIEEFEIKE